MDSVTPITQYFRLAFDSSPAASGAAKLLAELTTAGKRIELLIGPNRLVVWAESLSLDERVLYLSSGAYEQLRRATALLPQPTLVSDGALPRSRALLLGDANDWNDGATPAPLPKHVIRRSKPLHRSDPHPAH